MYGKREERKKIKEFWRFHAIRFWGNWEEIRRRKLVGEIVGLTGKKNSFEIVGQ